MDFSRNAAHPTSPNFWRKAKKKVGFNIIQKAITLMYSGQERIVSTANKSFKL